MIALKKILQVKGEVTFKKFVQENPELRMLFVVVQVIQVASAAHFSWARCWPVWRGNSTTKEEKDEYNDW